MALVAWVAATLALIARNALSREPESHNKQQTALSHPPTIRSPHTLTWSSARTHVEESAHWTGSDQ